MPAGELMKEMRRIFRSDRQFYRDQELMRRQRCFIDSGEELGRLNSPFAARPASDQRGCKRQHAGGQFGSRIGVRQASSDAAAIADRRMGDMGDGFRQQRRMGRNFGRGQEIGMPCQRTDGEDTSVHRNAAQLGQLADINNQLGGY